MDIDKKHTYVAIGSIIAIVLIVLFVHSSIQNVGTEVKDDSLGQAYTASQVQEPKAGITRTYPEAEPVYSYLKD